MIPRSKQQSGMSLIELMVSLTMGVFLIGGAMVVYAESRKITVVNEEVSRLQENARFALDVIEPDLRLANFWGVHNLPGVIDGRSAAAPAAVITNDCAVDWALNLDVPVEGGNGALPAGWTCIGAGNYLAGTDVLAVRHVNDEEVATAVLEDGVVYVRSDETLRGQVFVGTDEPGGFNGRPVNHALNVNLYYVRPYSFTAGDNQPSLRRLRLSGTTLLDEEVINGIENMQVQFGVDTNDDKSPERYVNSDSALLANPANQVVAVRMWLLARTEQPEDAFSDDATYTMGDVVVSPADDDAVPTGFRRLLISRTIQLRNI